MYRVTLRVDSNEKASEGPKNPPVNITEVPSGIAHEDLFRYYVNVCCRFCKVVYIIDI